MAFLREDLPNRFDRHDAKFFKLPKERIFKTNRPKDGEKSLNARFIQLSEKVLGVPPDSA